MKTLAHLATTLGFDNIRQISFLEPEPLLTDTMIGGISYVVPTIGINNYDAIRAYIQKILSSDPKLYEDATILVLNSTEDPNLLVTEEASLEEDGYQNIYTDISPTGIYSKQYTLYDVSEEAPGTRELLEEKYHTTAKPASELPASIPTDYDFVLILGA